MLHTVVTLVTASLLALVTLLAFALVRWQRLDHIFQVFQYELIDHLILPEHGLQLAALDPVVL